MKSCSSPEFKEFKVFLVVEPIGVNGTSPLKSKSTSISFIKTLTIFFKVTTAFISLPGTISLGKVLTEIIERSLVLLKTSINNSLLTYFISVESS